VARVTVEDCLEREDNLVRCTNRPNVASLREIAAGKVHFDRPSSEAIEEWIIKTHKLAEKEDA